MTCSILNNERKPLTRRQACQNVVRVNVSFDKCINTIYWGLKLDKELSIIRWLQQQDSTPEALNKTRPWNLQNKTGRETKSNPQLAFNGPAEKTLHLKKGCIPCVFHSAPRTGSRSKLSLFRTTDSYTRNSGVRLEEAQCFTAPLALAAQTKDTQQDEVYLKNI